MKKKKKMSKYKVYHPQFGFVGVLILPSGMRDHLEIVEAMRSSYLSCDWYGQDCKFEEA